MIVRLRIIKRRDRGLELGRERVREGNKYRDRERDRGRKTAVTVDRKKDVVVTSKG